MILPTHTSKGYARLGSPPYSLQIPVIILGVLASAFTIYSWDTQYVASISAESYEYGIKQCAANFRVPAKSLQTRTVNPRYRIGGGSQQQAAVFVDCTLWNGDGLLYPNTDVLVENGLVQKVAATGVIATAGRRVVQCNQRYLTPGLVDMHSHVGTDSWPSFDGNSDTNEDSSTITPQVRSLDAFNPWDPAIAIINSGGVTTSLVLPGSSNLIGGEAYAFKHHMAPSNRSDHMLLYAGLDSTDAKWRWIKFACGENPRHSNANGKPGMANTRLGEGWLLRQSFAKALRAKHQQDDWCESAKGIKGVYGKSAHKHITERYPDSIHDDTLVSLLRGQVLLNNHCYEVYFINTDI